MKKRALFSTYDKKDIVDLASFLVESGWEIISTGGTAEHLQNNNISVIDIADITGLLDGFSGRLKTMHPAIHGGLLAKRNDSAHIEALEKQGYGTIDLLCANLYPFFEKVQTRLPEEELLDCIDMGGPAMLRSAAKNYKDVIVLMDHEDYPAVIEAIKKGDVPEKLRRKFAAKAFNLTAAYDAAIAVHLLDDEKYPLYWNMSLRKLSMLRYGENKHQASGLYLNTDNSGSFSSIEQLGGKQLSYNNVRDIDLAWKAVCSFGLSDDGTVPKSEEDVHKLLPDLPKAPPVCCVVVKHTTICAIALGKDLNEAYSKAYVCDPTSLFEGIIACNVPINTEIARKLVDLSLHIVIAPDFSEEALEILSKIDELRVMRSKYAPHERLSCTSIDGGLLVQDSDNLLLEKWDVVTKVKPTQQETQDMIFALRAVTYIQSNAVVIVKNQAALGIASGETNRVWAAEIALNRATRAIFAATKLGHDDGEPAHVLAVDAAFHDPDAVEVAAATGIKAIVQPGGSLNDDAIIEACDNLGIAMVLTGTRHFKH